MCGAWNCQQELLITNDQGIKTYSMYSFCAVSLSLPADSDMLQAIDQVASRSPSTFTSSGSVPQGFNLLQACYCLHRQPVLSGLLGATSIQELNTNKAGSGIPRKNDHFPMLEAQCAWQVDLGGGGDTLDLLPCIPLGLALGVKHSRASCKQMQG